MATYYEDRVPAGDVWFSPRVSYNGEAVVEVMDPSEEYSGPCSVSFVDSGDMQCVLSVTRHTRAGAVTDPSVHERIIVPALLKCRSLVVSTPSGTLKASHGVRCSWRLPNSHSLRITADALCFKSIDAPNPSYWCLPLCNFLCKRCDYSDTMPDFPLLFHTRRSVPVRPVAVFEFAGRPAVIQLLPDYEARARKLHGHRSACQITAVMVGEVPQGASIGLESVMTWLPLDLVRLLGLATGMELGVPWFELRGSDGRLVSRWHARDGAFGAQNGHRFLSDTQAGHMSVLLNEAWASGFWREPHIRVALANAARASVCGETVLENKLDYLFRAFETLIRGSGLWPRNLLDELQQNDRNGVQAARDAAASQVRVLMKGARGRNDMDSEKVLNRIVSRLRNVANVDDDFGRNVTELLRRPGIADAAVMDRYVASQARADDCKTWEQLLSYLRNTLWHEGYIPVRDGRFRFDEVWRLANHLCDALVRLLFTLLGYSGQYTPILGDTRRSVPVDWVKPDTDWSEFGFQRPTDDDRTTRSSP